MSIASRIESMENNISNAYKSLDDLGIDLTNTNKNIENISTKIDDVYNMLSTVSGTGTDITLNNTAKGRLLKNELKGQTSQETLTGKNLFNKNASYLFQATEKIVLDTGVRIKQTEEGTYKFSAIRIGQEELLGKTLTLHLEFTNSSNNIGGCALFFGKDTTSSDYSTFVQRIGSLYTTNGDKTINIPSEFPETTSVIYILLYSNTTGTGNINDYVDYSDLQIEIGSTATSYEPYCGRHSCPKSTDMNVLLKM